METSVPRVLWFQRGALLLCVRGAQCASQAQEAQIQGTESFHDGAAIHAADTGAQGAMTPARGPVKDGKQDPDAGGLQPSRPRGGDP